MAERKPARWRISKCCSLCGKWELRDNTKQINEKGRTHRLDSWLMCVTRLSAIRDMESFMKEQRRGWSI